MTSKRQLQADFAQLTQIFERADVRLDSYGPELAAIFGDESPAHSAGRWTSETVVDDVYKINVANVPGKEQAVFTALAHGDVVRPFVVSLHPGESADFTEADFKALEAWVSSARSGEILDPNRHAKRAGRMAALVR